MRKLREVLAPLADVPHVSSVEYEYDCGDKRSYGSLKVTASFEESDLPFKTLTVEGNVGSSGGLESGWEESVKLDDESVEFEWLPEVEVPHYYAGVRTCERWEERANETLVEDLQAWLDGEYGEALDLRDS